MELKELGFDAWFAQRLQEASAARGAGEGGADLRPARVTRVDRGRYLVRNEQGELQAEPTGRLLYAAESPESLPCVGDWVLAQVYNDGTLAIIHGLLPRRSFLRRKTAGRDVEVQMIAANVDEAFIVQACDRDFNVRRLERYLVMVREGRLVPAVLLSKSDLVTPQELDALVAALKEADADVKVLPFSTRTPGGLERVSAELQAGRTYCLLGSSGVGKTTLLNQLAGAELFETAPVRETDRRGRHTTSRRQMTIIPGGAILIDTPGMRELGMIASEGAVEETFADIHELAAKCHFRDCSHTAETGCAVIGAVEEGTVSAERYESYLKLLKESAFHEMSYLERRRKEKQFGKMVNKALKTLPKKR